jgi:anion-transporting  ArsA/GET3 family ATPase
VYDAVVLDAPPTGRITRFLNVTAEVAGLTRVGPIKTQSDRVIALLRSAQTAVHIVTVLEEMPVQETLDAAHELCGSGLPLGALIVNMTRDPLLPNGRVDRAEVAAGLRQAQIAAPEQLLDALLREATEHLEHVRMEHRERKLLAALNRPMVELPFVPDGVDLGAVHQLADALRRQGATVQ